MKKNGNIKKVILDKKKCIGCATCVVLCPEVFSFDDNQAIAVINDKAIENAEQDKLKSAVQACPSTALSMEE